MITATVSLHSRANVDAPFVEIWSEIVEVERDHVLVRPDATSAAAGSELALEVRELHNSVDFIAATLAGDWRSAHCASHPLGRRVRVPRHIVVCLCMNGMSPAAGLPVRETEPDEVAG